MNLKNILYIMSLTGLCLIIGCNDEPDDLVEFTDDVGYYPIQSGSYWEYRLDSITYDNFGALVQNKVGYVRESVLSESISLSDTIYVVEVSRKQNFDDSWVAEKLIRIEKISSGITRIEDNLIFDQLVFPASTDKTWDGLQFIPDEIIEIVEGETIEPYLNWEYKVLNRDASLEVSGVEYSNLIVIQEADNENLINKRLSTAYYSQGVGMVYRYKMILDSQCINVDPSCSEDPWEDKAWSGYILEQQMIAHGQ